MTLKIICSWCKKSLGEKPGEPIDGHDETGSICPECAIAWGGSTLSPAGREVKPLAADKAARP